VTGKPELTLSGPAMREHSNARWPDTHFPALSVLIPVYRFDAVPLILAMAREAVAREVALVVLDDGSGDPALVRSLIAAVAGWPGQAVMVESLQNLGRSGGRNALTQRAKGNWWLFVDADMLPDDERFLTRWVEVARTNTSAEVVFGGFSLLQASNDKAFALHRRQSDGAECLPAAVRAKEAGKYVFTSNLLVHRDVFAVIGFDDGFTGWGWEDVDWGLRVAARFPVRHIDNPASHLGLATAAQLVEKYRASGGNFARLAARHPQDVSRFPVMKAAKLFARLPLNGLIEALSAHIARDPQGISPMVLRVLALKVMRACVYAKALKQSESAQTEPDAWPTRAW